MGKRMQRDRRSAIALLSFVFSAFALVLLGVLVAGSMDGAFTGPSPENGSNLTGSVNINVTFTGTANWTITWWNATASGYVCGGNNSVAPQSCIWDTTSVSDGRDYALNLTVVNATNASDFSLSSLFNLSVDNTAPNVTLDLPANLSWHNTAVVFLNWSVLDSIDRNATCTLLIDGEVNSTFGNETANATLDLEDGVHTWQVNCTDYTGNIGWSGHREFWVDTVVPEILAFEVTPRTNDDFTNATPRINVTINESHLKNCSYTLDGFSWSALTQVLHYGVTSCVGLAAPSPDGALINISVIAYDNASNAASNGSINLAVDALVPQIELSAPTSGTLISDGKQLFVNASVSDAGSGFTDGQACVVLIDNYNNESGVFSGAVTYNATSASCMGIITIGDPSSLAPIEPEDYYLWVYVDDRVGNTNSSFTDITVDNAAPTIVTNTTNWTNNAVRDENSSINISLRLFDHSYPVQASIGNTTVLSMSNTTVGGPATNFQLITTPSDLGCPSLGACMLTLYINDSWNNTDTNHSITIVIDNGPPSYGVYGVNQSGTAAFEETVLFYANWSDDSLQSPQPSPATLYKNVSSTPVAQGTAALNNGLLWSNITYAVNPSEDEGETIAFFIQYQDLAGYTNSTPSMSLTVENRAPIVAELLLPGVVANISNETPTFSILAADHGKGIGQIRMTIDCENSTDTYADGQSAGWSLSSLVNQTFAGVAINESFRFNISRFNVTEFNITVLDIMYSNASPNASTVTIRREWYPDTSGTNISLVHAGSTGSAGGLTVRVLGVWNESGTYRANLTFTDAYVDERSGSFTVPEGLPEGVCNATLLVNDSAGNVNSTLFSWIVDGSRPTVNALIVAGNDVIRDNETVTLSFDANVDYNITVNWTAVDTYLNRTVLRFYGDTTYEYNDTTGSPSNSTILWLAPGRHLGSFSAMDITGAGSPTVYFLVDLDAAANITAIHDTLVAALDGDVTVNKLEILRDGIDLSTNDSGHLTGEIGFLVAFNRSYTNYTVSTAPVDGLVFNWNNTFSLTAGESNDAIGTRITTMVGVNATQYVRVSGYDDPDAETVNGTYRPSEFLPISSLSQPTNWTFNASGRPFILLFLTEKGDSFRLLEPCTGDAGNVTSFDDACYTNVSNEYTAHAPNLAGMAFGTDAGPPNITVHNPLIFWNDSHFTLNFSVIEPAPNTTSFCSYQFGNTSRSFDNVTLMEENFTLVGSSRYFTKEYVNVSDDGVYLFNITCTDAYNQSTNILNYFGLQDNTSPTVLEINQSDPGLYSVAMTVSTNELSQVRILYGTSQYNLTTSTSFSGYGTYAEFQIEDLTQNTRHYYKAVACDYADNCGFSEIRTFRTAAIEERTSREGGGGGSDGILPGMVIASDFRGFSTLEPGWLRYNLDKDQLPITSIGILLDNATENAYIQLQSYFGPPRNVPTAQDIPYQYFQIVTSKILEHASAFEIEFRVPSEWLVNISSSPEQVHLFRLEQGAWVEYAITPLGQKGRYDLFSAKLPSFSFFAITADGVLPTKGNGTLEPTPGLGDDQPLDGTEFVPDDQTIPPDELPSDEGADGGSGAIVGYDRGVSVWWFILPVVLVVVLAGGAFLYYRKQYGVAAAVASAPADPSAERSETDPLYPLQVFIDHALANGHPPEQIRQRLLDAGWDDLIVEEEIESALTRRVGRS